MSFSTDKNAVQWFVSKYASVLSASIDGKESLSSQMLSWESVVHSHLQESRLYASIPTDDAVELIEEKAQEDLKKESYDLEVGVKEAPAPRQEAKEPSELNLVQENTWGYLSFIYAAEKAVHSRTVGDFFRHPFRFISERIRLSDLRQKAEAATGFSQEKLDEVMDNIASVVGDKRYHGTKTPKMIEREKAEKEAKKANKKEKKEPVKTEKKKKKVKQAEKPVEKKEEKPKLEFTEAERQQIDAYEKNFAKQYHKETARINQELSVDELDLNQLGKDASLEKTDVEKSQPKVGKEAPELTVPVAGNK